MCEARFVSQARVRIAKNVELTGVLTSAGDSAKHSTERDTGALKLCRKAERTKHR